MDTLTLVYLASVPPYLGFVFGMVCGLAFVAMIEWRGSRRGQ